MSTNVFLLTKILVIGRLALVNENQLLLPIERFKPLRADLVDTL